MRVRRLAAAGHTAPREVLSGVAPGDFDFFPGHADHFGGDAMTIAHRLGAEIADARLDIHPAVGFDDEQSVIAGRPRDEGARRDAIAPNLRSLSLAALR